MINKFLLGAMTASHEVGSPIIKGAKWLRGKTPKSVGKFGKKSKNFLKQEYKEMKHFAKTNPEMFVGSAVIGGAAGYGIKKGYQAATGKNKKKKKT